MRFFALATLAFTAAAISISSSASAEADEINFKLDDAALLEITEAATHIDWCDKDL